MLPDRAFANSDDALVVVAMSGGTRVPDMLRTAWSHPSNEEAKVRALLRCAYHFAMTRGLKRETTTRLGEAMRIYVNPTRPASSRPVYANPPDPEEIAVWRALLRPGDLVIDVGANIGIYTLLYAEMGAEVVAMEPGDTDELRRNLALNHLEVEVLEMAASDAAGTTTFTTARDQQNTIVLDGTDVGEQTVTVPTRRLDDVLDGRHARGIKIDVEGFERLVLAGLSDTLAKGDVDLLQIEWNRQSEVALGEDRRPLEAMLAAHGYRLARPTLDGRLIPCSGAYDEDETIDRFAVSPACHSLLDS